MSTCKLFDIKNAARLVLLVLLCGSLAGCSILPGGEAVKKGWKKVIHELKPHRLSRLNMATEPPRGAAYFSVPPPSGAIREAARYERTTLPRLTDIE